MTDHEYEDYPDDFDDCSACGGAGCPMYKECGGAYSPGTEECDMCEFADECGGGE